MLKLLIFTLTLFSAVPAFAMRTLPFSLLPAEIKSSIVNYVTLQYQDLGVIKDWRHHVPLSKIKSDAWYRVKQNYALQLVSKDFKRMFWDCFTVEEKDAVIWILLEKMTLNNCFDTAMSMKASLYPILRYAMIENNIDVASAIINTHDVEVINKASDFFDRHPLHDDYWEQTPLLWSIVALPTNLKLVQVFLQCPATNVNKGFPLWWAIWRKDIEIIKSLLARPDIQVNVLDSEGETVLFMAAHMFNVHELDKWDRIISLLVQAGIDSSVKNNAGKTVCDVAREYKRDKVIELIEHALAQKKSKL